MVPPFKEGDSMYAIASVLTPSGIGKLHGQCLITSSDGASSLGGMSSLSLVDSISTKGQKIDVKNGARDGDEKAVYDPVFA